MLDEKEENKAEKKADSLEPERKMSGKLVLLIIAGLAVFAYGIYSDVMRSEKSRAAHAVEAGILQKEQQRKALARQALLHMSRIVGAQDTYYFSHRKLAPSVDALGYVEEPGRGCIIHRDTWEARDSNESSKTFYQVAVRPCELSDGTVASNGCFIVAHTWDKVQKDYPMFIMLLSPIKNVHSFKLKWGVFALTQPDKMTYWREVLSARTPIKEQEFHNLSASDGMRYASLKEASR